MKLILINSNDNDSFAAVYYDKQLRLVRSTEFATKEEKPGRSPGKLINCLIKLRSEFGFESADAVSVTIGPGSFTGIRVGLALAKGIAGSLDKPLIAINNFDLQYERITGKVPGRKYCVLIPAKKPEFYYAVFEQNAQSRTGCETFENIIRILDKNTVIAGNFDDDSVGKHPYFEVLNLKKSALEEDRAMIELCERYYSQGKLSKPEDVEPLYIKEFSYRVSIQTNQMC